MKQIICLALLLVLAASRATIPELYKLNNGSFTSDYSVTYNNPLNSREFGVSSEAGDINNDGIPDFLLANPNYDGNKGIVYVIYGKKGSLRQLNSMDDFQPSDGFIIKGNTADQNLGFSVSAAGDVNGDGIDDIIIGTAHWNSDQFSRKAKIAYVLFGRKSSSEFPSTINIDSLSPTQGFKIFDEISARDSSKFSVSGAGDVNGDGLSDIIVGKSDLGNVYVIFGSKQGSTDMTLAPAAGKGFTVLQPAASKGLTILYSETQHFSSFVSKAGDFNGDGIDDLVIGTPVADQYTGKAYIIFGRRGGFPTYINPSYPRSSDGMMMIQGANTGDRFGCTVSNAGDVNGDGLQDVIIGAYLADYGSGAAYVIFGSRQNPSELNVKGLNPSRGFTVTSSSSSQIGFYVGGGRDINGDGKSDIIIGAPGWNQRTGAVYVLYGNSTLTNIFVDTVVQPHQGFAIFGQKYSGHGQYVSMLKDINGDGLDDFILGAFWANGGKGAANLFYLPWKCMDKCSKCSKPDTCEACDSGFGFLGNECTACPPNTHTLVNGVCKVKCSANCASCSRPNTCDSCIQGYGFLNSECVLCPSGTHILSGGFCIGKCTQNCAYCTRPGSCDICISGFGFLNNVCTQCNSTTHFLNNGICQAKCPENCAQCTQPNSCSACSEGFGFLNNACVICPEKTHFLNNGVCHEDRDAWKQIKDLFDEVFHKNN